MKKLKAFTLIELLVTMAISGIVISATYFCLNIVTRQFGAYRSINGKTMDIVLLQSLLEQDFNNHQVIKTMGAGRLQCANEKQSVDYEFGAEGIIRKQDASIDTFKLITSEQQFLFEGHPDRGIVDELRFNAQFPDTVYTLHFIKEYDPGTLMRLNDQPSFNGY